MHRLVGLAIATTLLLGADSTVTVPSLDVFDAVGKLGAGALFAIALFALYTRRVRTRGEAEEDKAEADARLAEMRVDRDAWKAMAQSGNAKLDRLTDVLETFVGKKLSE